MKKKILVIVGHADKQSLCAALANAYIEGVNFAVSKSSRSLSLRLSGILNSRHVSDGWCRSDGRECWYDESFGNNDN